MGLSPDIIPLFAGILIAVASLVSLRLGISVAIVEILLGIFAGNIFGIQPEPWMDHLAGLGGILLTFLAGVEIDLPLMKSQLRENISIGTVSFMLPFLAAIAFTYWVLAWPLHAALIAGIALSTTSLAVVYSVLVENDLTATALGKRLMAATFITDVLSVLALTALFVTLDIWTMISIGLAVLIIIIGVHGSDRIFSHPAYRNKVAEPEVKVLFVLLLGLAYLGAMGHFEAILPVFFLGLFMSPYFTAEGSAPGVRNRLRSLAFIIITPFYFIDIGLKVSLPEVAGALGLFGALFAVKEVMKIGGVYPLARKYVGEHSAYFTLIMSTGLTFGTIITVFGFQAGYITQTQFSVLIAVVVASAVIPTLIAQIFFRPKGLVSSG